MNKLIRGITFIIDNYDKYYNLSKENQEYEKVKRAWKTIQEEIIFELKKNCVIDEKYEVKFNRGNGNKPAILLLSIRNKEVSKNMMSGIYVVLLIKRNEGVYISLNQGTEGRAVREIIEATEFYRDLILKEYTNILYKYELVDDVKLCDNLNEIKNLKRPKEYESGNIIAKYYSKKRLLKKSNTFIEDIKVFLDIYENFIKGDNTEVAIDIEDEDKKVSIISLINVDELINKKIGIVETEDEKVKRNKSKSKRKINRNFNRGNLSEEDKKNVGWLGERYIYERLKEFNVSLMSKLGIEEEEVIDIHWFNSDINIYNGYWEDMSVGFGCDIIIECINRKINLEVKSSVEDSNVLTITGNELRTAYDNKKSYYIIKVNNLIKDVIKVKVINNPYEYFLDESFKDKLKEVSFYL